MIGAWLGAPRLDLPLGRDASGRFLPWIVALMVYLAALGGAGLVLLGDALHDWDRALATTLTLQVPADATAARVETVLALLRQTPGVAAVHLLEPAETARLLEPWLGPSVPIDTLPLPRLIDLRIDPNSSIDFAALQQRLNSVVPEARIDDHRLWLGRLRGFAVRIEGVIAAVLALVVALMVASVVFAARTGLAIHHPVIELLHLLGAGDLYIARQFQIHALRLGLLGGGVGAVAAAVTLLVLAAAGRALDLPAPGSGLGDWRVWALLVATGMGAGLVAMTTARLTVLRRLARMP